MTQLPQLDSGDIAARSERRARRSKPTAWVIEIGPQYEVETGAPRSTSQFSPAIGVRRAKSALKPRRGLDATIARVKARYACDWLEAAKQRLRHLAALPGNWNSYGAETPGERALFWAHEAVELLMHIGLAPTGIVPSAENGVAIVFKNNGKHADIEFFNDGDIAYLLDDGVATPRAHDISANRGEIGIALGHIRTFLGA